MHDRLVFPSAGRPLPQKRSGSIRWIGGLIAVLLAASGLVATSATEQASAVEACDVTITSSTSEQGFTHPGIGLTKDVLDNARQQIADGQEPWTSYYDAMTQSSAAGTSVKSSNASATDPTKPATTAFDSQSFNARFVADGLKSYTQTLMYIFTGEQVYRSNAMAIIRIWEQMDPAKYVEFTDSHIHTGIPLNRMATAAELLRYSGCASDEVPWTEADTTAFTENLIKPVIATFQSDPNHFMNQHNYPLIGSMAGRIFMDDVAGYEQAVEWFTVNSTATDQGFNGSVSRLFRMVEQDDKTGEPIADPHVQHVEMGRDQAHGGGDITNAYILSRMLMAQGTKVDPVLGTVSTASDAVGPYEFLNDRILAAADYFWKFQLGYDTEWTPMGYAISPDGTIRDTYDHISNLYKGRFNTASFWDLYYYYTYERGEDVSTIAPYFAEAFSKRLPSNFYYNGTVTRAWDSGDAGGEFWLYVPAEAAGTSVPKEQTSATVLDIEDRYTNLAGDVSSDVDDDTGYVRLATGGTTDSKIAFMNGLSTKKQFSLRVRTDGIVTLKLSFGFDRTIIVPDTGGQWRNVVVDLTDPEKLVDMLYIEASGDGAALDIDSLNTDTTALTAPILGADPERVIVPVDDTAAATLSATDSGSDALVYGAEGLPAGADLDPVTGDLTWTPSATGSTTSIVTVDDGATVAARNVELIAVADRAQAITEADKPFDSSAVYTAVSKSSYDTARAAVLATEDGSEQEFLDALASFTTEVDALELVSPRIADGSLDYPGLLATSSAGANAWLLVDGDNQTGTVYNQSAGLSHVFDFGPFARVSAKAFGLQSSIFEDRIANSAVFGSDDGVTWTRLTPEVTTMTQDFQTLQVSPELQNQRFQFFKVQNLEPVPDVLYGLVRNLFEMMEFHIYGERFETVGDITSVSLSAPDSLKGRVVSGSSVQLAFTASKPISGVEVTIAGAPATATSDDGKSWVATATLPAELPAGLAPGSTVPFTLDHTTGSGETADRIETTSDGSKIYVSSDSGLLDQRLRTAVVSGDDGVASASLSTDAGKLFDSNATTYTDTRVVGSKASLVWDLGEGASASVSGVDVLVRQDQFGTSRLSTLRFEGSNDLATWEPLTSIVQASADWQRLTSVSSNAFRYLRLTNGNIINLAEARVFGTYTAPVTEITSVHASSTNSLTNYAVTGDTVSLDIVTSAAPQEITATIDGKPADVVAGSSPTSLRASAVVDVGDRIGGTLAFTIDHVTSTGQRAITTRSSTDGSTVRLGTTDRLITDLMAKSTRLTPTGAADTSTVARPANLFDGKLSTFTDARVINGSADIVFDLGTTREISLDRAEIAMRQDTFGTTRLSNLRIQGSDDLQQWTTLVTGVKPTLAWQGLDLAAPELANTSYRYLRITNGNILNIAELRLYGAIASPITTIDRVDLTTYRNEAPTLPETVHVTRADESTEDLPVIWEATDASTWSAAGEVEVEGTVPGSSISAVARVTVVDDGSTSAPATAVLSSDNGHGTGLADSDYTITVDLWWGSNARVVTLRENGAVVGRQESAMNTPQAQKIRFPLTGRANGTYMYSATLVNSSGSTTTQDLTVEVKDANPGKAVVSSDNWDGDGSYTVIANMWWGTNATSYAVLENGVEVATGSLAAATPSAQSASYTATGRAPGSYEYQVVFTNAAGSTTSDPHVVTVTR